MSVELKCSLAPGILGEEELGAWDSTPGHIPQGWSLKPFISSYFSQTQILVYIISSVVQEKD